MSTFRNEFKKQELKKNIVNKTNFLHTSLGNLNELEQINGERFRTYKTPDNKEYPSVTTILSLRKSSELEKWRNVVGKKYADEYTARFGRHGTYLHQLLEDFLANKISSIDHVPAREQMAFRNLEPLLRKHITKVNYQEANLYSNKMRLAGRVDLIGEFDYNLAIIDFKTSTRPKTKDEISNYFIQETAYSIMFEELLGIKIERLIVIMNVENDKPIIFHENRNNWIDELRKIRKEFYKKWNI